MRAIFELSPLTVLSERDLPENAIECSTKAINLLHTLLNTVEKKKNERMCRFYSLKILY